jgi:hypothetical protein
MYLIEVQPGTEVLYNSVDELRAAILGGEVGPEYRKIGDEGELGVLRPLKRKRWTFFSAEDTDEPSAPALPAEVNQAETRVESPPILLFPEAEKSSLRELVTGVIRRLRIPRVA